MKKLWLVIALAAAAFFAFRDERISADAGSGQATNPATSATTTASSATTTATSASDDRALEAAIARRADGVPVIGAGVVVKVLSDDRDGSPHQRFILRLPSGNTVLIAHNIELADRLEPLAEGDRVEFNGEYAWNDKGGVVHWTHHDPAGRHADGWLRSGGQTVQ